MDRAVSTSADEAVRRGGARPALSMRPAKTLLNTRPTSGRRPRKTFSDLIALLQERGLCFLLFHLGRRDEGLRECQISQQLDPTGDRMRDVESLYLAGEEDRAIASARMLVQADPNDGWLHSALSRYYARKGMYKEASQEVERALAQFGDPDGAARVHHALTTSGGRAALRQSARELEHWMTTERGYCPGNLAAVYAILGDKDRAFYWLEEEYKHHDLVWSNADIALENLKSEHMFDSLRSDPRYKDLLRRVGLPP